MRRTSLRVPRGFKSQKALEEHIRHSRSNGEHGLCSAFLDVWAELFGARNAIVHEGSVDIEGDSTAGNHRWVADKVYPATPNWFATYEEAEFDALDAAIDEVASTLAGEGLQGE